MFKLIHGIGNREIEKVVEVVYNRECLPFDPWTAEEFVENLETNRIEKHLSDVYSTLASSTTMSDSVNVLLYFESIICNTHVSNRLINTVFMNLLVKMLRNVKSPALKVCFYSIM